MRRLVIFLSFFSLLFVCCFLEAGEGKWTTRGPYGSGGVDSAVFTFHPTDSDLIFVSLFGGVWRSVNGGEKWQKIYFDKDSTNVPFYQMIGPQLAIHPKEPGTIIAARFFGFLSYGVFTVFKSIDRGVHWEIIHENVESPWNRYTFITDIEFHPQDPNVLYISFYRRGMIKSIDGGKTWFSINNGLPVQEFEGIESWDCLQVEVDPLNGDTLYTVTPDAKVYKSVNGGTSWVRMSEGLSLRYGVTTLKIVPKNPQTLYAAGRGGIFKTTDAGLRWEKLPCKCDPASFAVDPANSNILYYTDWVHWVRSNRYKVFKSINAGKNWTELPVPSYRPSNAQIAVHPLKRNDLFIEDDERIYRSRNFGKSWQSSNTGLVNEWIGSVAADPSGNGRILATRSDVIGLGLGRIFESKNGGGSWRVLLRTNFYLNDVQFHPADAKVIVAVGDGVAVSSDGGLTWQLFEHVINGHTVALHPTNPDIIYGPDWKSTDRGRTWEFYAPDRVPETVFVDPHNGSTIFVMTTGLSKLYRSTNAGKDWTMIGKGLKDWSSYLLFDPINSRIMYSPGARGVYKSTDYGNTWALKRNGLPERTCCGGLVMDPINSQVLYVAAQNEIYFSKDGGEQWSRFPSRGLEKVSVTALASHPTRTRTLFAGTETGVYTFTFKSEHARSLEIHSN